MTCESIKITLPLPAKVLQPNCTIATFGGRFAKAAAIKRYRKLACEAVLKERVESAPWALLSVEASFFFGTVRKRDQDNFMGSLKAVYDGIVDSGLTIDDDYKHMQRGMPEFSMDKKFPRVDITITRLPEPRE